MSKLPPTGSSSSINYNLLNFLPAAEEEQMRTMQMDKSHCVATAAFSSSSSSSQSIKKITKTLTEKEASDSITSATAPVLASTPVTKKRGRPIKDSKQNDSVSESTTSKPLTRRKRTSQKEGEAIIAASRQQAKAEKYMREGFFPEVLKTLSELPASANNIRALELICSCHLQMRNDAEGHHYLTRLIADPHKTKVYSKLSSEDKFTLMTYQLQFEFNLKLESFVDNLISLLEQKGIAEHQLYPFLTYLGELSSTGLHIEPSSVIDPEEIQKIKELAEKQIKEGLVATALKNLSQIPASANDFGVHELICICHLYLKNDQQGFSHVAKLERQLINTTISEDDRLTLMSYKLQYMFNLQLNSFDSELASVLNHKGVEEHQLFLFFNCLQKLKIPAIEDDSFDLEELPDWHKTFIKLPAALKKEHYFLITDMLREAIKKFPLLEFEQAYIRCLIVMKNVLEKVTETDSEKDFANANQLGLAFESIKTVIDIQKKDNSPAILRSYILQWYIASEVKSSEIYGSVHQKLGVFRQSEEAIKKAILTLKNRTIIEISMICGVQPHNIETIFRKSNDCSTTTTSILKIFNGTQIFTNCE